MATKKKMTPQDRLARLRRGAKQQLATAGTVQFRLDEESMLRLMQAADDKRMPLGTLVRMWMIERLNKEGYTA